MKHPHTQRIALLAIGALAAGLSSAYAQSAHPTVITPPAIKDGSNASRAPFPAARQFDDVKGPDRLAIDQTGANSPVANIEPLPPSARVAIAQPPPATAFGVDPGLLPTGRSTVVVSAPFQAATFAPTIRSASLASRDEIVPEIEVRLSASERALAVMGSTKKEMSAAGRQAFEAAERESREMAKALRKSLRAAKNDAKWDSMREQLAADYEAYAAVLARIDSAAGIR